jgi:hypothetical protein
VRRVLTAFLSFLMTGSMAHAQLGVYVAGSYGYNSNPMYNYQEVPDQVKQGYFQIMYGTQIGSSSLMASYVNSLALFNTFDDRNYLEHGIAGTYALRFGGKSSDVPSATQDSGADIPDSLQEETGNDTTDVADGVDSAQDVTMSGEDTDSSGVFLNLGLKASQRLDRTVHEEFDNLGLSQQIAARFAIGDLFVLRLDNVVDFRSYLHLPELSNVNDMFTARFSIVSSGPVDCGVRAGAGVKHFVNAVTDTSKFEEVRSYIVKPAGHGKPGGKIKSTKLLLANATTNTTSQVVAGLFANIRIADARITAEFLESVNSKTPSRYLAQTTTASGLNQDIYNDQFSYEGWLTSLAVATPVWQGIQASANVEVERKTFGAEAYTLAGDLNANKRIDRRRSAEVSLSRSFFPVNWLELDVTASVGVMRNESNDQYSDFSCMNAAIGVGIGL